MAKVNLEIPDEIYKESRKKAIDLDMTFKDYCIQALKKVNQKCIQ